MEDFMGQKSCSSNTGTSSSSTNFIYGSAAAAANTYDNCFYGRGGDGGFPHHHQYDNDPAPPMVKIESEKVYCAGGMQHNQLDNQQVLKSKIIFHPHYSNLLQAYMDCQKVGAPPEVVGRLTAVQHEYEARQRANLGNPHNNTNYKDPELDQFMEAYYDMLIKYKEELTRPIHEAVDFMRRIESQLSTLNITTSSAAANTHSSSSNNNNASAPIHLISPPSAADDKCEVIGSSEEEENYTSGGETTTEIDPRAEDRELKNHLLRKYSGYISSLKQELSKKKKKGKLPKEARQKLLSWWELHYKWPYPSESEKVALAETTGLDQKQINNWFINQRKRHWKPSEDMQFMVMQDPQSQHHHLAAAGLYMQQQDPAGDHHYMHHLHPHPDHPNYRLGP